MKIRNLFLFLFILALLTSCSSVKQGTGSATSEKMQVAIDLVNVTNDQVSVTVIPPAIKTTTTSYQLPKIIPGTYAIADYGRYITDFSALDKSGKPLDFIKKDVNTWEISNAGQLGKITYLVNDTYDSEEGQAFSKESTTIFSPAGTNILSGKQFMLNMGGFVGYFGGSTEIPYEVSISHPEGLTGTTAMTDMNKNSKEDLFITPRYAALMDSPVMYAAPDISSFVIDGMTVVLHVYSPVNKNITSQQLTPDLKRMMTAQKKFLGKINDTEKYAILVYITSNGKDDARGLGALEHNQSTTAVFAETMSSDELIHVISHEFFHTLTPLKVHSKEIHYFDFNNPKMSAHLWMYEGFTEYFANLFQVNQGLITEDEFYALMSEKERYAIANYPKDISFTEMSKNILEPEMKEIYPNVYQKGALMAMCIDLIIRDKSKGKRGLRDMMGELSEMYGPTKPFDDAELIPVVTKITYPEVGDFLQKYVVKGEPLDYAQYLKLAGVDRVNLKVPVDIALVVDMVPFIKIDQTKMEVIAVDPDKKNELYKALGVQNNDVLVAVNGKKLDASDVTSVLTPFFKLKVGNDMKISVNRNGSVQELSGKIKLNYVDAQGYQFADPSKSNIKEAWLKN
jgi:predicted metalloprotease with PDZ domain